MEEAPPAIQRDRLNGDGPDLLLVLVTSFLVPGAGYLFLRQYGRAAGFFVIILVMFSSGLALDGKLYEPDYARPLTVAATIASHGSGLLDLSARFGGWTGDGLSRTYEYGTAFILTAGMMNLLLILDVWDRLREARTAVESLDAEADEDVQG